VRHPSAQGKRTRVALGLNPPPAKSPERAASRATGRSSIAFQIHGSASGNVLRAMLPLKPRYHAASLTPTSTYPSAATPAHP
jgi:hypothetical protein